jgi:hypothetical protein
MTSRPDLTAERLRSLLRYNPESGQFAWRRRWAGVNAGDVAGFVSTRQSGRKYLQIKVDGRIHQANRLAWLYVTGSWPTKDVLHRNGDALDNSLRNLYQRGECDVVLEFRLADAEVNIPMSKECRTCGERKPATTEFFYPAGIYLDSYCKVCQRAAGKAKRAANLEKARARDRARRQREKEKNPDQWRTDKYRVYKNGYIAKNKGRHLERRRARYHAGLSVEEQLNRRMSRRLRRFLKTNGLQKEGKPWRDIIGYSAADLRSHLERQFARGMGWHNISDWQIDHILPLASFKYESSDDPEFRAAWALSNLRPLWRADNQHKSARRLHLI